MALQFVSAPELVYANYQESLLDFIGPHAPAAQEYHLPVGALGLAELAAGATLDAVVASGCRMLAMWPDGTWTSCELTDPTLYIKAEFRNITRDSSVGLIFTRIAEAQFLDAVQKADYELHLLSVPGIYLDALHLVSQTRGADIVLPLVSIDPQLGSDTVFDEAAFLTIARACAAARVKLTSNDPLSS
jgi:hypothetical protein